MTQRETDPAAPPEGTDGDDGHIARTHGAPEDRIEPADAATRDAERSAGLDPTGTRREGAYADAPADRAGTAQAGMTAAGAGAASPPLGATAAPMAGGPEARETAEPTREAPDEAGAEPGGFVQAKARILTTALPFGWKGMLAFGMLTVLGGVAAILTPFLASLTVAAFAAATFVILGVATLWMAFRGDEAVVPHRAMNGAIGALMIVFGVLIFVNPLEGLLSLTILVAAFFVAEGVMRLWLGYRSRGERDGAGWLMLGGAVSILLGAMVFLGLPESSIFVLGLFLGIDLLGTGVAMIALSVAERKATGDAGDARI